jgi:hypothetical protein
MINIIKSLINQIAHPAKNHAVKETPADEKTKAVAAKRINQKPLTEAQQNLLLATTLAKPIANNEGVEKASPANELTKAQFEKVLASAKKVREERAKLLGDNNSPYINRPVNNQRNGLTPFQQVYLNSII